jgi:hypothetical protein
MYTSPEFQLYVAQQPQASQLPHTKIAIANPEQPLSTTETGIAPPLGQLNTVALVQYGGISVAIILSIAVFILALAEYNKSFLPVILQKPDEKTKPQFSKKGWSKNNISQF